MRISTLIQYYRVLILYSPIFWLLLSRPRVRYWRRIGSWRRIKGRRRSRVSHSIKSGHKIAFQLIKTICTNIAGWINKPTTVGIDLTYKVFTKISRNEVRNDTFDIELRNNFGKSKAGHGSRSRRCESL